MGGRARRPLPFSIRLTKNNTTGYYEGEENGITYILTYSQMNALKQYFHLNHLLIPTFTAWYNSLNQFDRKEVKRLNTPCGPQDFFPDIEYPINN